MAQLVCRFNRDDPFHEHMVHTHDKPAHVHLTAWVNTPVKLPDVETSLEELMDEVEHAYHETSASVYHYPALNLQGSSSRTLPLIVRLRPGMTRSMAKACVQKLRSQIRDKYRALETQEA